MNDRKEHDEGAQRTATAWVFGFMAGALILALLVAAYQIGYNHGKSKGQIEQPSASATTTKTQTTSAAAATGPGKQLFAQTCGTCHTLSAAGTSGTVGPNLDDLKPDEQRVLAAIQNGGTGSGTMPPNLYTGQQAQQVAAFVAATAGQ